MDVVMGLFVASVCNPWHVRRHLQISLDHNYGNERYCSNRGEISSDVSNLINLNFSADQPEKSY